MQGDNVEHQLPESDFKTKKEKLDNTSIERYSRQLILPEIGVKGEIVILFKSCSGTKILCVLISE